MAGVKITKFGGLNRKSNPKDRPENAAIKCLDVDLSEGYLKPVRTDKKVSEAKGNSLYIEHCCYITSDNCKASFAKIPRSCNYLISTEHRPYPTISTMEQACNGEFYKLGFPDMPAPTASVLQTPRQDFNREERTYLYTLVKSLNGLDEIESQPSVSTDSITVDNDNQVMIAGIPAFFDPLYKITKIRIYCAATSLDRGADNAVREPVFMHIADIAVGETFYLHEPHTNYGHALRTVKDCAPAPDNMKSIQYCGNGQIAGIVDCDVWLSEPLSPHSWNEAFILSNFQSKPIRILGTEQTIYVLTDGRPSLIEMQTPCKAQGCRSVTVLEVSCPIVSYNSACLYNGACFYASTDGIVMLAGTMARVITSEIISKQEWLSMLPWTMRGAVHNGWYYGTTDKETFKFKVPDQINENAYSNHLTNLSINASAWYVTTQNRLHYADSNGIYEVENGTDWKTFTWRGTITTPSKMAWRSYKLTHDYEPATVKHVLNQRHKREMVAEAVTIGDAVVIDSKPQKLKAGYSGLELEFEISSKGAVYEYHIATSTREIAER